MLKLFRTNMRKFSHKVHMTNDELFKPAPIQTLKLLISQNIDNHSKLVKNILDDPMKSYYKFNERLLSYGLTVSFPEFEDTVRYLENNIKLCLTNTDNEAVKLFGHSKLIEIMNILYDNKQNYLPYADTIRTIYDSLEFFDIYERLYNKNCGVYYHSLNYKYYMTKILNNTNVMIFPTIYNNLSVADFIKTRPVPLFFCGTSIKSIYVDEYLQSSREYFMHDFNHSRRMAEYFEAFFKNNAFDKLDIINQSMQFANEILCLTKINYNDSTNVKAIKQLIQMIIFEIIHEDALYLDREVVWNACHRDDNYTYVFEKSICDKDKINVIDYPITVEGALAYTKFKLQYKFYDDGTNGEIVIPEYRYAKYIAFATIVMLKKLYPDKTVLPYSYYLKKTCQNDNMPLPVHKFKVGNDENKDNIDITSLKTGVRQNYWRNGHRRIVGEHLGISVDVNTEITLNEFNSSERLIDEIELSGLFKLFNIK